MAGGGVKINYNHIYGGADGATFIPSVSSDGWLTWQNNKGYQNPADVNIKGADGGRVVSQTKIGEDSEGGYIYRQVYDNGDTATFTAPRGEIGAAALATDERVDVVDVPVVGEMYNFHIAQCNRVPMVRDKLLTLIKRDRQLFVGLYEIDNVNLTTNIARGVLKSFAETSNINAFNTATDAEIDGLFQ